MGRCSVRARRLLLSCEHGGNRIPRRYARLFRGARRVVESHAGFDPGALAMARRLARRFDGALHAATVSRLLIDLNRSLRHPRLFSSYVGGLDSDEKRRILEQYYLPHRARVEERVRRWVANGDLVLHVAVHSFVPELTGTIRRADLGLLYDPARRGERRFCRLWAAKLREEVPCLRVRLNYPYRGTADGLTTSLRRRFPAEQYWGVELEVNQTHLATTSSRRSSLQRAIENSLMRSMRESVVDRR